MEQLIVGLLQVALIVFIVRAVLSWFRISGDSPFYPVARTVIQITEPVLSPIRRVIPPLGGIDLSILAVIIAINYLLVPIVRSAL